MAAEALSQDAQLESVNLSNDVKVESENVASNLSETIEGVAKDDLPIVQPNKEEVVHTSGEQI